MGRFCLRSNIRQKIDDEDLGDAIGSGFAAGAVAALVTEEIFDAPGPAGEIGLIVGVLGFILDAKTKHIAQWPVAHEGTLRRGRSSTPRLDP